MITDPHDLIIESFLQITPMSSAKEPALKSTSVLEILVVTNTLSIFMSEVIFLNSESMQIKKERSSGVQ